MALIAAASFIEFRQRWRWTALADSRCCRWPVCRLNKPEMMSLPCPKVTTASGFDQGKVGRSAQPATLRDQSQRHAGCALQAALGHQVSGVGRLDHCLSRWRRPLPSGRGSACAGDACGRRRVPVRVYGPIRLCAITKVAQRPDHLVDATGVVTQNLAVPLEPVGDHRMVGCRSEMFAGDAVKSMTSVSGDHAVSRKVQLSAERQSAIATILTSGARAA